MADKTKTVMSMGEKVSIPDLDKCEDFASYKIQVGAWALLTKEPVENHGGLVAMSLPSLHKTHIREKVFQEYGDLKLLKVDTGLDVLLTFMKTHLGKNEIEKAWECFEIFDGIRKTEKEAMSDYISNFDTNVKQLKDLKMVVPPAMLALKVLKGANVTKNERLLILTDVDFDKPDEMYADMKKALLKFKGAASACESKEPGVAIKFEPSEEQVLYNDFNRRGRGGFRGRGRYNNSAQRRNFGGFNSRGSSFPPRGTGRGRGTQKPTNKLGRDGNPLRCNVCDSIFHLSFNCPDAFDVYYETEYQEDVILYTANDKMGMKLLDEEARKCAVLDSGCTSTVCGMSWFRDYCASLSEKDKKSSQLLNDGFRAFRFGGGEVLASKGFYKIPAVVAGKELYIETDVVDANIPLLLSKQSMKRGNFKLNLADDSAELFGKLVSLNLTSSGHYCIPLDRFQAVPVENVYAVNLSKLPKKQLKQKLGKLHRQFAHPTVENLKKLLVDSGSWEDRFLPFLEHIYKTCETCKTHARTPCRPVVSMPLAKRFNDKVALDLKKWKNRWILHMIDMWTRFTISTFIDRKKPSGVIDMILLKWVGAGHGTMRAVLTDNGGEFTADEVREICSILNVETLTSAADSPFQNGVCEKNHGVVDNMLIKLVEQCPKTPIEILLCWANNAKNSLQMWHGFSSYQLVYGQNPNLPNVMHENPPAWDGRTMSETLSMHLNALHEARKVFIESETSERIRRALRHKVRTSSERYENGDRVFYKRDGKEKWLGPAKVVFQDGQVVFVRHGSQFVRVSPNRLIKMNYVFRDEDDEADVEKPVTFSSGTGTANPTTRGREFEIPVRHLDDDDDNEQPPEPNDNDQGVHPDNDNTVVERPPEPVDNNVNDDAELPRRSGRNTVRLDYKKLHTVGTTEEVLISSVNQNSNECFDAKISEMDNWNNFDVFEEVDDIGQSAISTRWVISEKLGDDGTKSIKARLVARGFEERDVIQSDSPTATKEVIRLTLALSSTLNWPCKTIDIKAAFLQGRPIEREVFLFPPPEAESEGKLWKLKKAAYGLSDASRSWYFSVKDELLKLECEQSKLDQALFYYKHNDELSGIFVIHVDDFIWCGDDRFKTHVIDIFSLKFKIGKEASGDFRYIGLEISHDDNGITMAQRNYSEELKPIKLSKTRTFQKDQPATADEKRLLRGAVGQLTWITTQTRPDVSFETLELSTALKEPKIDHLIRANKAIKQIKSEDSFVRFPKLGNLENLRIVVYTDAAFANLSDGYSSTSGYIVFLVGDNNQSCPIVWKSTKIKRVVRSTLAAETLSLVNGIDDAVYVRFILQNLLGKKLSKTIPIHCIIDNKSLVDNLQSTKSVHEKKLRIDTASIKQMLEKAEISSVKWVDTKSQIADSLTKRGVAGFQLRDIIQSGILDV